MQNFEVTNKEYYGMLWYFWSGQLVPQWSAFTYNKKYSVNFEQTCL